MVDATEPSTKEVVMTANQNMNLLIVMCVLCVVGTVALILTEVFPEAVEREMAYNERVVDMVLSQEQRTEVMGR